MFSYVGQKIQTVAKLFCWVGVTLSIVYGCITILGGDIVLGAITKYGRSASALAGIFVIAIGSFFSWISSLVLYGFGELVENSERSCFYQKELYENIEKNDKNKIFKDYANK